MIIINKHHASSRDREERWAFGWNGSAAGVEADTTNEHALLLMALYCPIHRPYCPRLLLLSFTTKVYPLCGGVARATWEEGGCQHLHSQKGGRNTMDPRCMPHYSKRFPLPQNPQICLFKFQILVAISTRVPVEFSSNKFLITPLQILITDLTVLFFVLMEWTLFYKAIGVSATKSILFAIVVFWISLYQLKIVRFLYLLLINIRMKKMQCSTVKYVHNLCWKQCLYIRLT